LECDPSVKDTPPVGANGFSAPAAAAVPPTTDAVAPAPEVRTGIPLDSPAGAPPVVVVDDGANRASDGGGCCCFGPLCCLWELGCELGASLGFDVCWEFIESLCDE